MFLFRLFVKTVLLATLCQSFTLTTPGYWNDIITQAYNVSAVDNLHAQAHIRSYFSTYELEKLNQMVAEFRNIPGDKIWAPVEDVSKRHPFFFFHQRKAGGSSIRNSLHDVSRSNPALTSAIIGIDTNADMYTIPRDRPRAIYGGHYKWGAQHDLAMFHKSLRANYSCTSNFRMPTSRIESCLYYRFAAQLKDRCLQSLSDSEFDTLLQSIDEFGTSCWNEPFRSLSGFSDEVLLDHLMDETLMEGLARRRLDVPLDGDQREHRIRPFALMAFNQTLRHVARCAPLILELPETFDLLNIRFPIFGK
jgi:hypothetical protein